MRAYAATPDGAGPYPAVVLAMHGVGVDAFMEKITRWLADAGYAAITPDLFHRDPPKSGENVMSKIGLLRDVSVIKDMGAGIEWLKGQKGVRRDRIGVVGFCMGGRVSYLMAAASRDIKAAVVYYGGNIKNPWGEGLSPLQRTREIGCPVLGLFGDLDTNPSPADVKDIDAELTRHGKLHEFHTYKGANHGFMMDNPQRYNPDAAKDAWPKTLAWFEKYLKR
jgi:carboxymethylenebutenolidase